MLLKCSEEFDDILFSLKRLNPEVKFARIKSGIQLIKDEVVYPDLDSVLNYCAVEYKDQRTGKEIKRMRTTSENLRVDNAFSSYILLYINLKDLIVKASFRHLKYVADMLLYQKLEHLLFYLFKIEVGEIIEIDDVEGSDKLYVEQVMTKSKIQIVSGIREYYTKDFLLGKKVLFLTNIKKSKIRGNESDGMILCAKNEDKMEPLFVSSDVKPGTAATIDGDDMIKYLEVAPIDIKRPFSQEFFAKFKIKDNVLMFYNQRVLLNDEEIRSQIENGLISYIKTLI